MQRTLFKSQYGHVEKNCYVETGKYTYGNMRYISLFTSEGEPFGFVTTNIPEIVSDPRYNPETDVVISAHHDEGYLIWAMENLDAEIQFLIPTGYVLLPVVRINLEKLKLFSEFTPEEKEKMKKKIDRMLKKEVKK